MKQYKVLRVDMWDADFVGPKLEEALSIHAADGWRLHTLTCWEDGHPRFVLLEQEATDDLQQL